MILLQVTAPYLINKFLSWLEKELRQNPDIQLTPEAKEKIINAIPALRHAITILHRFNF